MFNIEDLTSAGTSSEELEAGPEDYYGTDCWRAICDLTDKLQTVPETAEMAAKVFIDEFCDAFTSVEFATRLDRLTRRFERGAVDASASVVEYLAKNETERWQRMLDTLWRNEQAAADRRHAEYDRTQEKIVSLQQDLIDRQRAEISQLQAQRQSGEAHG